MPHIIGRTGEVVYFAGTYRDSICGDTSYFTVGDRFTPCRSGGSATWTLVH